MLRTLRMLMVCKVNLSVKALGMLMLWKVNLSVKNSRYDDGE